MPKSLSSLSIRDQLIHYGVNPSVIENAEMVWAIMKVNGQRSKFKGNWHVKKLFYCTYMAYRNVGIEVLPDRLCCSFGLTPTEIQNLPSIYSYLQTGYRSEATPTTAESYIRIYCLDLGLSAEAIAEVEDLVEDLFAVEPSLRNESPKTFVSGVLRYYMNVNGIEPGEDAHLEEVTTRCSSTIKTAATMVARIHNGA